MPYTPPTTITTGDLIGAAQMNSDWVDNISFLADVPRVSAYRNADQTITTATDTIPLFNAETYDTDSMHSTSSNQGRLTASTAGLYEVRFRCFFAAASGGYRQARIWLNGVGVDLLDEDTNDNPSASTNTSLMCLIEQYLDVGEYVEAAVYHTRGSNLALLGSGQRLSRFSARWVAVS